MERKRFGPAGLYKLLAFVVSFILVCDFLLWSEAGSEAVYAKDGNGDIVVVIDPGHGAYDGGAVSPATGDSEAVLNWNIAKYMKAELETYAGVRVYVTRAGNEWYSNAGRALFGKAVGADVVISIHNNSSGDSGVNGFVAYGSVVDGYVEPTKNLCLNMARYIQAAGLGLHADGYLTRRGGNPAEDYYTIIDEGIKAGIPTIIAEHCFLSNASDADFIHGTENQRKVGVADAAAVAEYFGLSKRTITDGQIMELDRSYSAYFIPANTGDGAISFASSDENVAHVRYDGLITALNAGTATITYTYQDGTGGSCTFISKPVVQIGVTAGITPTVYRTSEQVAAIDKSKIMVKAIYSDGTCRQQTSGYTVGDIDPYYEGRQYVTVSHNGFNGELMLRLDKVAETGNYSDYLYQIKGEYSDIFTFPELVALAGVSGSPYTSNGFENTDRPTQAETTTEAPTTQAETTTEAPTTRAETTTEAPTTQAETTTEAPTTQTETAAEATESTTAAELTTHEETTTAGTTTVEDGMAETETTKHEAADRTTAASSASNKRESKSMDWFIVVLIVLIVLMFTFIVFAFMSIRKNNIYNRRLEQRERAQNAEGYEDVKNKSPEQPKRRTRNAGNDEVPKRRKH